MKGAFLVGFRGSGKTTLGAQWAAKLGIPFVDLDAEFEAEAGCTILEFVDKEGLGEFRRRELVLLQSVNERLLHEGPAIVATGGGCVETPAVQDAMQKSPVPKVFLSVSADELWRRLAGDPVRLKIGKLDSLDALAALLAARRPLYEKIATYTVRSRDITETLTELMQLRI